MRKIEGEHSNWYDAAKSGLQNSTPEEAAALKFSLFLTATLGIAAGYIAASL